MQSICTSDFRILALSVHRGGHRYFQSAWGRPRRVSRCGATIGTFRKAFESAVTTAKLGAFGWHDLGHSAASFMVQAGVSLLPSAPGSAIGPRG